MFRLFVNRGILTLLNCLKLILLSLCLFACNGNNNAFKVIDTGIHVYTGLEWKDDSQIFYVEKKYIDEKDFYNGQTNHQGKEHLLKEVIR